MSIRILPDEVASQIAAGEVVERPASAVKELLENALDAKAENVRIMVEGAGKRLIEVSDDGIGIETDELALAVQRHATSKLSSSEDLFQIASLGFRGEALASIASVSRLTIVSCPKDEKVGAKLRVEGGNAEPIERIGAPTGTTVRVEDLFYNVPARLKFLKSDNTERRLIDSLVTRYALAYPEVRIQLQQNGRYSLQTSGNGDRREVLAALYGVEIARKMLEVNAEYEGFSLNGFISPPDVNRSNRREITFFVNGRWVQEIALTTALVKAYHTLLMSGRYPLAVGFINMPPEDVDVNVHPTKSEVRFKFADKMFRNVQRAVRRALLAHTPVPEIDVQLQWSPSIKREPSPWDFKREDKRDRLDLVEKPGPEDTPAQPQLPGKRIPLLRVVGQIATSYVVAEGPDGLYLVDQHAAHERVLFERFMAQRSEQIPSQQLLEPVTIELPPHQSRLLEEQIPTLDKLGFQVEHFGHHTFILRSVPSILSNIEPQAALRVLVEDFEEDEAPLQEEIESKIIARVCKRAAVRAGKVLSPEEQRALLRDLEACDAPRTCPHGRPTMIHLSVDLLERQFGRRGPR